MKSGQPGIEAARAASRKIQHAAVYGTRSDRVRPDQSRPASGNPDPFRSSISLQLDKH
jgi:hypothetical protein